MTEREFDATSRLTAWLRCYGHNSQKPFVEDIITAILKKNEKHMRDLQIAVRALREITKHSVCCDARVTATIAIKEIETNA